MKKFAWQSRSWLMATALGCLSVAGCDLAFTTQQKQVKACVEDLRRGLGDPSSLEVLTAEPIAMEKGHRIKVEYTAKNAMGGRARSSAVCGFKTAADTSLDPDDYQNRIRGLARDLNQLGVKTR
jgi:hypothetical protein